MSYVNIVEINLLLCALGRSLDVYGGLASSRAICGLGLSLRFVLYPLSDRHLFISVIFFIVHCDNHCEGSRNCLIARGSNE